MKLGFAKVSDDVTQQNAALVEEATAAAESMQDQAQTLTQAVTVFKLTGGNRASLSVKNSSHAQVVNKLPTPDPIKKAVVSTATELNATADKPRKVASGGGDWEEF